MRRWALQIGMLKMMKDLYPEIGKKQKVFSLDDAWEIIKQKYPTVYMEGSAGLARHFCINDRNHILVVGYAWSSGKVNKDWNYTWYVRVFPEPKEL